MDSILLNCKRSFSLIHPKFTITMLHLFIHQFISSKSQRNSDRKLESNHRSCFNQYLQIDGIKKSNLETMGYYDTITDEDIVRKQYSLLPYPSVTAEQLEREKTYYNGSNFITKWTTYRSSQ